MASIHPDFVSLSDLCPGMKIQSDYSTSQNFTGSVVDGYKAKKAFLAKAPAGAICEVQSAARKKGLALKIFDAYRPQKAVQFFLDWAKKPEEDILIKNFYYPRFTRLELFEKGFIAKESTHSRGSAVDLTLFDLDTGKDLDMGTVFDFFDELSHTESPLVTKDQLNNRLLLKNLMESNGFKNFSQEWWHFSFRPEPFPEQAFNFDVE